MLIGVNVIPAFSANVGKNDSIIKEYEPIEPTPIAPASRATTIQPVITPIDTPASNSGSTSESAQNDNEEPKITEDKQIYLNVAGFDPLQGEPTLPASLQVTTHNKNYYILQCMGFIQPEWIQELQDEGVIILGYLPDNAYIGYMDTATKALVEQLFFIRWIGEYQPGYKIASTLDNLNPDDIIDLNVGVFHEQGNTDNLLAVTQRIEEMGGWILYPGLDNSILTVRISASKIDNIARIPQVASIGESGKKITCMDNVRDINYTGAGFVQDSGFNGSSVIGEVKDDGLNQNHPDFAGQIFATDGNPPAASHGTCTFGIVFSSGANNAQAKGMLPNGRGVFCYWTLTRITSIYNLKNLGGVFQSNSWCQGTSNGAYTAYSAEDDLGVSTYDITMLYAAGNQGNNGPASLYPDAAAKNVISVGAVNTQDTSILNDDSWGSPGGSIGIPSYGPTADGRIKPDLCGPNDYVFTTDWVGYNGYRIGNYITKCSDVYFGDTSAATAVVAGATGLVYDMYKKNLFGNNPTGITPHAATVKAMLIATAYQYPGIDRMKEGWGVPRLQNLSNLGSKIFIVNEETALQTGHSVAYSLSMPAQGSPLKISLVWTDPAGTPGAQTALVNNLDLKVTAPNGTVFWGNHGLTSSQWSSSGDNPSYRDSKNNVENVFIENPEQYGSGTWTVTVIAQNIALDGHSETTAVDQDFALVATTTYKPICGDANNDGIISVSDVVYLTNYLFIGGPEPVPMKCVGDVNGNGIVDISDVVYLINYLFINGPAPGGCCRYTMLS
jgi:hypothetical protein